MSKAIIIEKYGDVEELKTSKLNLRKLGPNEVLIRQTAIGINFIDIYQRKGIYPLTKLPAILGYEGAGYIEEIGQNLSGKLEEGQRVAFATAPGGSYSTHKIVDYKHIVSIPDEISEIDAAAYLFKGLTAHYLLRRAFFAVDNNFLLIHSAAGGLGTLMCQWAKHLKAHVIGTVGSDAKIDQAKKNGCKYVYNYNKQDFAAEIMQVTNNFGVNAVFDGIGQKTFEGSLNSLCKFGLFYSLGQTSGAIEKFSPDTLSKSIYFSSPSLFDYKFNRNELILSADEVFFMIKQKILRLKINKYSFDDIKQAHINLESGNSIGAHVIKID